MQIELHDRYESDREIACTVYWQCRTELYMGSHDAHRHTMQHIIELGWIPETANMFANYANSHYHEHRSGYDKCVDAVMAGCTSFWALMECYGNNLSDPQKRHVAKLIQCLHPVDRQV